MFTDVNPAVALIAGVALILAGSVLAGRAGANQPSKNITHE
ncbi:hypothetical protein [Mycolicibacterium helvum]|uniref:Uncharacterized protein n=1 Tax=Mycolicibacterium helvum TaxID=1534349 RepID=A0A7I7TB49_9MYCO|nr:hypothetical protein [Mycolicibacterium helvum]BBY66507.1 hypothetical protein MHEL_47500 [Mycolicibacterium helvum]